jgi:hypothetical protein
MEKENRLRKGSKLSFRERNRGRENWKRQTRHFTSMKE